MKPEDYDRALKYAGRLQRLEQRRRRSRLVREILDTVMFLAALLAVGYITGIVMANLLF